MKMDYLAKDQNIDEDEDEIFFGAVSEREKRKANKFSRRKTAAFVPGFREDRKLMRYTIDPTKLGVVEEEDSKENFPPNEENVPLQKHVLTESATQQRFSRQGFVVIDYVDGREIDEQKGAVNAENEREIGLEQAASSVDSAASPADPQSVHSRREESAQLSRDTAERSPERILRGFLRATMASDVAIRQFDFGTEHNDSSMLFTDDDSIVDSSLKEDVSSAIQSLTVDPDESINSSLSSNGPKPEILSCDAPADVETPKAAKLTFDMSPLVENLPALKVTTPMRLHDEQNSAFKMYGSQGELRIESSEKVDGATNGGDSGIEDAGSESPSKMSRASSCTASVSPEVTEVKEDAKKDRNPAVHKQTEKCASSTLKSPKVPRKFDRTKTDIPGSPRTPRTRSEDRVHSYIHSNEKKVKPIWTPTSKAPKSPVLSAPRSSRPVTRSRRVDPKEVTKRLVSPAPRCSKHQHSKVNTDGRPEWNSSTLIEPSSTRGCYLSSKDPPYSSPFSFTPVTPSSTPRSPRPSRSKKSAKDKDNIPKLDLDRLEGISRRTPSKPDSVEDKGISQKRPRSPTSHQSNPVTKRQPFKSCDIDNTPHQQLLSLNEYQLDAVTSLHTLCNGQQQAKFVTKPHATSVIRKVPEPKNQKIQWPSNPAVELDCPSPITPNKTAKPILHIRKPDELFPYNGQPPSPVVVKKTVMRRNANPLSQSTFTF